MARWIVLSAAAVLAVASSAAAAQTTAGIGTTIVFPVTAQTSSFLSEVTIFNPGPNALTAHVTFFEANNSATPGTKVCTNASVPANRSLQFSIGTQCPLAAGSHFGLLVVADSANPQSNFFYGYTRVQNPLGIGFSVEGFPVGNFNNQVSHSTGLKRQAAAPTYQTNCFVGSLEQPVSYEVRLFNDSTGTQIGGTLTGSLNAFEQFRYLDVFGPNGVNAPAGDQFNVRAQFTPTSGGTANLIGFCTVQDNTSFGADFRIAKSYGVPGTVTSITAGTGLTGGTISTSGTISLAAGYQLPQGAVNNQTLRYDAVGSASWIVNPLFLTDQNGGVVMTGTFGAGIAPASGAGGRLMWYPGKAAFRAGYATSTQWDDPSIGIESIGLGYNTVASGANSTSIGGTSTASGTAATTLGWNNIASGSYATAIGNGNIAAANNSIAMGQQARTTAGQAGSFVFADSQNYPFGSATSNEFAVRATSGARFVTDLDVGGNPTRTVSIKQNGILDFGANTRQMINLWDNAYGIGVQSLVTYFRSGSHFCWFAGGVHSDGSGQCDAGGGNTLMGLYLNGATAGLYVYGAVLANSFSTFSDRNAKTDFEPIEPAEILSKVVEMPIARWSFKSERSTRHIGPMAQDFAAAFYVGADDKHIATVDADGVALAAIQGLYQVVQQKDARIAALEQRVSEMESMRGELAALKSALAEMKATRATLAAH